jgi:hypothetical protein
MSWHDYALDAPDVLSSWKWLLGDKSYTIQSMTPFGDLLLVDGRGDLHFLDIIRGECKPVDDIREEWFMPDLAMALQNKNVRLKRGQCYAFKTPPVLSGRIEPANVEPMDAEVYHHIVSQIHEQVRKLPPGTKITGFKLEPPP